ncbi:MAG TPA: hypothetical protein VH351_07410 [Bryobacteraceae bacterium]|nr:hypothetical protein [Bryobacteraceae bacterium]
MTNHEFLVIAPARHIAERFFPSVSVDRHLHSEILGGIHTLREEALRETAASDKQSAAAAHHFHVLDRSSWHVVLRSACQRVVGCARYRQIAGGFEEFRASESAIARSTRYGPMLKDSFEKLVAGVRQRGKEYGEAGGWALRPEVRGTTAGFNVALMTYALAEHLGSGLAVTTATRLNQSASILRRIGARRLSGLPGYYEPEFSSVMEIVHFDLPCLNTLYASKLQSLQQVLTKLRVVCAGPASTRTSVV